MHRWKRFGGFDDGSPKGIRAFCYRNCGEVEERTVWGKFDNYGYQLIERTLITPEMCEKRFRSYCTSYFPNSRRRPGTDTRRMRHGKLLGHHHGKQWYGRGNGKASKKALHQAERRMYREYSERFRGTPEECVKIYYSGWDICDHGYGNNYSMVDWRND